MSAHALAKHKRTTEPDSPTLQQWLQGSDEDDAAHRIDIYGRMYFGRQHDVMKDFFPSVHYVVGDAIFHNLMVDFFLAHPSKTPLLQNIGEPFPAFLQRQDNYDTPPWLPELAQFELMRIQLMCVEDHEIIGLSDLQTIPPEQWGALTFQPVSSSRVIPIEWNVDDIWLAKKDEQPIPSIQRTPKSMVFWRYNLLVYHAPMKENEARAFAQVQQGKLFAEVCECFLPTLKEDEEPTPEIFQQAIQNAYETLSFWLNQGLLQSFSLQQSSLS